MSHYLYPNEYVLSPCEYNAFANGPEINYSKFHEFGKCNVFFKYTWAWSIGNVI